MGCETIQTKDGVMIVCSRGGRRKVAVRCDFCGLPHEKLCDWPKGKGTCDRKLCWLHAGHIGTDTDYCPAHLKRWTDQQTGVAM